MTSMKNIFAPKVDFYIIKPRGPSLLDYTDHKHVFSQLHSVFLDMQCKRSLYALLLIQLHTSFCCLCIQHRGLASCQTVGTSRNMYSQGHLDSRALVPERLLRATWVKPAAPTWPVEVVRELKLLSSKSSIRLICYLINLQNKVASK